MKIFFTLGLLLSLKAFAYQEIAVDWKKMKGRKEVEVYKSEVPGSDIVAFKGIGKIDAPIRNVVSVIHDVTRLSEWISDFHSSYIVTQLNTFEKIQYLRTKTPWPLDDREFIYRVTVEVDKKNKSVEVLLEGVDDKSVAANEGVVRGMLHKSKYFIKAESENRTHIEVQIFADPKGKIPKWVVNLFQSAWPSNTISGIRKLATESNYKVHSDVKKYLEKNRM